MIPFKAVPRSRSAEREGFRFVSDPAAMSLSVFAELGRERNGLYFR